MGTGPEQPGLTLVRCESSVRAVTSGMQDCKLSEGEFVRYIRVRLVIDLNVGVDKVVDPFPVLLGAE